MEGGLFQAFYMLFKTNADEAEKELDGIEKAADDAAKAAGKATDEFEKVGKAGANGAKKAAQNVKGLKNEMLSAEAVSKKLSSSFLTFAKGLAAPLLGALTAGGLMNVARTRAAEIDALSKGAAKVNMPVGEFEAFGRAARDMGGDVKAAETDLQNLYKKIGEAAINAKSDPAKQFAALGVNLKNTKGEAKNTKEVLLDLARTVEKLDPTKATARLRKLGVNDQGTIDLLLKGRKAVEEMMEAQKRNGVVTEEQARIVGEFNGEMDKFGDLMKGFGNTIAEYVLPGLAALSRGFRAAFNWVVDNKTLVQGFFVGVAGTITAIYLPAILSAVTATIALLAPYLAIAAAVLAVGAAFALAWEDVSAFLNGQPSLLGDLVAKYEWVAKSVKAIGEAIEWVGKIGSAIGDELGQVWANQAKMNEQAKQDIIDAWNYLQPYMSRIGQAISKEFSRTWGDMAKQNKQAAEEMAMVGSILKSAWDKLTGWASSAASSIMASFAEAWPQMKAEFAQFAADLTPTMGDISGTIEGGFQKAVDYVKGIWDGMVQYLTGKLNELKQTLLGWWTTGTANVNLDQDAALNAWQTGLPVQVGAGPRNPQILERARARNMEATAAPFGAQTGAQVAGPTNVDARQDIDRSVRVQTGPITIETAATDAAGIAAGLTGALEDHFRATTNSLDDGIER